MNPPVEADFIAEAFVEPSRPFVVTVSRRPVSPAVPGNPARAELAGSPLDAERFEREPPAVVAPPPAAAPRVVALLAVRELELAESLA